MSPLGWVPLPTTGAAACWAGCCCNTACSRREPSRSSAAHASGLCRWVGGAVGGLKARHDLLVGDGLRVPAHKGWVGATRVGVLHDQR